MPKLVTAYYSHVVSGTRSPVYSADNLNKQRIETSVGIKHTNLEISKNETLIKYVIPRQALTKRTTRLTELKRRNPPGSLSND